MLEMTLRQGIKRKKREHPRSDQKTERPDAHRLDRLHFLGDLHRAELGRERRADPRREHDPGEQRPQLAGKSNRDQPRHKTFRPESLQLIAGQQRHRQAKKK